MIFKKNVWLTPFNMERTLHIYVPDDAENNTQRYPVLYMFDGHNLFEDSEATYGKSWGLKDYLDEHREKPVSYTHLDVYKRQDEYFEFHVKPPLRKYYYNKSSKFRP